MEAFQYLQKKRDDGGLRQLVCWSLGRVSLLVLAHADLLFMTYPKVQSA